MQSRIRKEIIMPELARSVEQSSRYIDDDSRWQAWTTRDRRADGAFIVGVVTTGVYCRPSCSGRPKRENVRFYADAAGARAAGLRACKRCKPDTV
jgi:AraC family transcriptional regulator, regulatory protein of adaptative response / methylated-DNA-[protein]-cysteine methyltransferase